MAEREVRYCTTEDGVRIAYCVEGEGPALLMCQMYVESMSATGRFEEGEQFRVKLGEGRQIIRYDLRGTGLSDRKPLDVTFEAQVLDIEAVVKACDLDRFALWGCGLSGPRAITFAARHPEAVSHLILFDTYAAPSDVFTADFAASVIALIRTNWDMASQMLADISLRESHPEAALKAVEITRRSVDPEILARIFEEGYQTSDAGAAMGSVKAKTLVLHRVDDPAFLFSAGQRIASSIPGAQLVPLEGKESYHFLGDTSAVLAAVDRFLGDRTQAQAQGVVTSNFDNQMRTILFTDLVGHTAMMRRLGDEKGREVLREYERITRDVLKAHEGTEVKTMGDGFMASFGSVIRGVECAIDLQRSFEQWNSVSREPMHVRVGLNAGEPIEEGGDLFGSTVILASRIAAAAQGGEVLASMAVRELCSGKGFLFADRGEHAMRGFEDPVRVFEVSWRE